MSAQRKSKDGLVKVLFVRVDEEMLADLDLLADEWRAALRMPGMSRSDFVRSVLLDAIAKRMRPGAQ